jgi:hypothetical protein
MENARGTRQRTYSSVGSFQCPFRPLQAAVLPIRATARRCRACCVACGTAEPDRSLIRGDGGGNGRRLERKCPPEPALARLWGQRSCRRDRESSWSSSFVCALGRRDRLRYRSTLWSPVMATPARGLLVRSCRFGRAAKGAEARTSPRSLMTAHEPSPGSIVGRERRGQRAAARAWVRPAP